MMQNKAAYIQTTVCPVADILLGKQAPVRRAGRREKQRKKGMKRWERILYQDARRLHRLLCTAHQERGLPAVLSLLSSDVRSLPSLWRRPARSTQGL